MPVFYILIILAAALLWFLLSFMFKPLGKLVHRLWKDAKDAIDEEDKNKEEN
jgi:hypothetical protein